MRLYKQELKRILKSSRGKVIILLGIVLPILFAFLANEFNDANYLDANGETVPLHGTAALQFIKDASSDGNGEATVERLKDALRTYQSLYKEYGTDPLESGYPLDSYWHDVQPIRPFLRMIIQTYTSPDGTIDLQTMSVDDLDSFYENVEKKLTDVMKSDNELRYPAMISLAQQIFHKVKTPFTVSHGYTRDAFDYIEFLLATR